MKTSIKYILLYFLTCLCYGCIEEIDLQTEAEFESVLVVEATVTNELKHQKVLVSRTYKLEEERLADESNAVVKVIGDGVTYNFYQSESGIYLSESTFSAQPNTEYYLEITSTDGTIYKSTLKTLTKETQLDDLFFHYSRNYSPLVKGNQYDTTK